MIRLLSASMLLVVGCSGSGQLTGAELAREVGCLACHTDEDTNLAPTLHRLWGSEVVLEDGSSLIVDEDYVRRSITEPGADIVAGYGGRMPMFDLTDSEVERLVDYVRSLQ